MHCASWRTTSTALADTTTDLTNPHWPVFPPLCTHPLLLHCATAVGSWTCHWTDWWHRGLHSSISEAGGASVVSVARATAHVGTPGVDLSCQWSPHNANVMVVNYAMLVHQPTRAIEQIARFVRYQLCVRQQSPHGQPRPPPATRSSTLLPTSNTVAVDCGLDAKGVAWVVHHARLAEMRQNPFANCRRVLAG